MNINMVFRELRLLLIGANVAILHIAILERSMNLGGDACCCG
jgi:hypothetical protein